MVVGRPKRGVNLVAFDTPAFRVVPIALFSVAHKFRFDKMDKRPQPVLWWQSSQSRDNSFP